MYSISRDRLGFLREMTSRHGDVVRFYMGPRPVLLVSSPEGARHVLKTRESAYRKGMGLRDAKELLGQGLLTSEGGLWQRQRARLQPLFGPHQVESYVSAMVEETAAMLERWAPVARAGGTLDLTAEALRLTLRILGRTLFGADFSGAVDTIGAAMTVAMKQAMARMILPASAYLPTPGNLRFRRALAEMDALVQDMMDRRQARQGMPDILSALMGEPGTELSREERQQIRDEVMTLIVAGHETTAALLCWTWCLLSRHPEERERLEAEVGRELGDAVPTLQHLSRLQHCRRVLDEAMRLYPPVWILPRQAVEDDEIEGVPVPAGMDVLVSPYTVHRHAASWEQPESFMPDRFLPARSAGRSPFAFLPFGIGPRMCIGKHFGLVEAQCVLAMVARRFRVELVPGTEVEPEPLLTLRPKEGLRVRPVAIDS